MWPIKQIAKMLTDGKEPSVVDLGRALSKDEMDDVIKFVHRQAKENEQR